MFTKNRFHRATTAMAAASLLLSTLPPGTACGPWFPRQYLAQGGTSLLETPAFFAEIELGLLARDFPTPFRAVRDEMPIRRTGERDVEDFDTAVAAGAIRPADPEAARLAHRRMREIIRQYAELTDSERAALPSDLLDEVQKTVFPSEFADYHEGLLAYSLGHHAEACAVWERLLARPEEERHYRSVDAAFMIGLLGGVENWNDAPRWFAMARDLAARGFSDSGGLAAASYDREGGWHEQRGELHAAAECAMRSISSGYPAAGCVYPKDDSAAELAKFAADPLLRAIHTSVLLAGQSDSFSTDETPHAIRLRAWLRALEVARVRKFAGAGQVAWLCYGSADYDGARRWLARAPQDSPRTLWLAGKLAARDGKREESLRNYSAAARLLEQKPEPPLQVTLISIAEDTTAHRLAAEQGIAAIGAPEWRTAFDAFMRSGHLTDAAYVAERLLTIEELREAVSRRPWCDEWADERPHEYREEDLPGTTEQETATLRWLFARRLVRTGRYEEARSYFPPLWRPALDRYASALATGNDARRPAEARALAFWEAALEARYHGIELLGTEAAPDWFAYDGDYELDDPAAYRLGKQVVVMDRYAESPKQLALPAILKASPVERARLNATAMTPDKRFHYRYRAAILAWEAARLLPDNDPRLAAILNLAGRWLAGRDPAEADRFYQALESRCDRTELGRQATALRWFVDVSDPAVRDRPEALHGAGF